MEHAALKCLCGLSAVLEWSDQRGTQVMHEGLGALPLGGLAPSAVQFLNEKNTQMELNREHKRAKETLKSAILVIKPSHFFVLQKIVNV